MTTSSVPTLSHGHPVEQSARPHAPVHVSPAEQLLGSVLHAYEYEGASGTQQPTEQCSPVGQSPPPVQIRQGPPVMYVRVQT